MEKIITVKGIGHVSVKPDLVVVKFKLETTSLDYGQCMKIAGERNEMVKAAVIKSGLAKDALKTSNFDMGTETRSVKNKDGGYNYVFDHWRCTHNLKVEFPMDIKRLSAVLHNVAESKADCEVDIDFTISDPSHVEKDLLESAAKNARTKAEVLCSAMGAKLGELVNIDYNWKEIDIYSTTRYSDCAAPMPMACAAPEIDPDDIDVSDNATFIWRIE